MTTPVVFFDFDGTLTRRDSLLPFLHMVSGTPLFVARMSVLSPVLVAYAAKLLKNDVAKEIVLKHFLQGKQLEELRAAGQRFATDSLPGLERFAGMKRLSWHKEQGHSCVLVSASIDIYLAPWARNAGFDDWIASRLEVDDAGCVTGRLVGGNCFGEEKVRRIRAWLNGKDCMAKYAYGDSHGDLPMLNMVSQGYLWRKGRFVLVR